MVGALLVAGILLGYKHPTYYRFSRNCARIFQVGTRLYEMNAYLQTLNVQFSVCNFDGEASMVDIGSTGFSKTFPGFKKTLQPCR